MARHNFTHPKPGRLETIFRQFDLYGHDITVKYDSKSKFRTKMGACASLTLIAAIVVYACLRLTIWKTSTISTHSIVTDLGSIQLQNLSESNFDIMLGFYKNGKPVPLDDMYGTFEVSSGEGNVNIVSCDIGSTHFSRIEEE